MDDLSDAEKAQLARFDDEHHRTAPLPAFEDDPAAIRSLFKKGYLDKIKHGKRPAMYKVKKLA